MFVEKGGSTSERAKLYHPRYPRLESGITTLQFDYACLFASSSDFPIYHTINMTTYIPSLTLPSAIFENAAISILFPIVAGTAVGFSTQRKDKTIRI